MKILHVYKDFHPPVHGGMERHIGLLCRYQAQWAEVRALVCSRSWRTREIVRDGTRVREVGEWGRLQSAPLAPAFPWHLARMPADVLVVHCPNPTAEVSALLAARGRPVVVRYHSDVVRQAAAMRLYGGVQQHFLRRAQLILPTSQQYLDTSPTLAPHRDRCRVVPLGIEVERFATPPPAAEIAALQARYGLRFVLFAGVHRYYKGLHVLVAAARDLNAPLVIAGDGPETLRLRALAQDFGVPIAFPGRLSDAELVAHLHACTLVVFPSVARSEAFGIGILEAHACGRPVVATRLGTGVEYANQHDKTGLNVAVDDAAALARAVNDLLAAPDRAGAMGAFAQQRVRGAFDIAAVARAEFDWYQEAAQWPGRV